MSTIKFIEGNLFSTGCQTVVNTVNCVGVMGAGVALEFKYRYPKMFHDYVELCKRREIQIGKLWLYKDLDPNRRWVLNFPTKNDWKYPSKIEYLELGLQKFVSMYETRGIKSIAWPLLGASNGGLDPKVSYDIMMHYLNQTNGLDIEIYKYSPKHKDDLIDVLQEALRYSSKKEIRATSGMTAGPVQKILNAINTGHANSVMALSRCSGIGKETVEKAFRLALGYYDNTRQDSLFQDSRHTVSTSVTTVSAERKRQVSTKPRDLEQLIMDLQDLKQQVEAGKAQLDFAQRSIERILGEIR